MPYYTRYKKPAGVDRLKDRVLRALEEGPKTTLELFKLFPEYKSNSVQKAVWELIEAGHNIKKMPAGKTLTGFTYYRWSLVKKPA